MTNATLNRWLGSSVLLAALGTAGPAQAQGKSDALEEVLVTGSYIKRASQEDMASPVQVLGAEDLKAIGVTTVSDIVNTLTINTGAQVYSNPPEQAFSTGTTNINLRGLGVNSTLVLLNGRRQTLSPATTETGASFVDLGMLMPAIAVDRVEILKDGASSLYGSDAVAGVVNFVTRAEFTGFEVDLNYTDYKYGGADEKVFGAILGVAGDRGHIMAAFNYLDRSSMLNADRRDVYADNQDSWSGYGNYGKVVAFDRPGPPAKLIDPQCKSGQAMLDWPGIVRSKVVNPDGACELNYGYWGDIVSAAEQTQAFTQATINLTDDVKLFGEIGFARNVTTATTVPSQPMLDPLYVSETHPDVVALFGPNALTSRGSPSGRGTLLHRPLGVGDPANVDDKVYQGWRYQVGLKGDLTSNWSWEAAYTHSINEATNSRVDVIKENMQAALDSVGGPNRNLTYHPFWTTQGQNTPEVYEYVLGRFGYEAESSQSVFDAQIVGDLFETGAGPISAAFGVQSRTDKISYDYNERSEELAFEFFGGGADFSGSDDVFAAFAELAIPLADQLEMQVALRYEDLGSDTTIDPKLAVLWRPTDNLSVRGSWGTSFRAPTVFQNEGQLISPQTANDPVLGGEEVTFIRVIESDPNDPLGPQDSTVFNLGFTWAMDIGLTFGLDYWNFDYTDYITPESLKSLLATDPSGPQIERPCPTCAPTRVTTYYRNVGSVKTDGIDFNVSYDIDMGGFGRLRPFIEGTKMFSYDMDDPLEGHIDGLGSTNDETFGYATVEFRANFGAYWSLDNHNANVIARHIGTYDDDNWYNGAKKEIDSWTRVDLQYSYQFESGFGIVDQGPKLTLGVLNVFDEEAPTVRNSVGYDATIHDPRGRMVYVGVRQAF